MPPKSQLLYEQNPAPNNFVMKSSYKKYGRRKQHRCQDKYQAD